MSDYSRHFDLSQLLQWESAFALARHIQEDLLGTESFNKSRLQALWKYAGIAREFMEGNLPFWEMESADGWGSRLGVAHEAAVNLSASSTLATSFKLGEDLR